jgi:hypothetical protein
MDLTAQRGIVWVVLCYVLALAVFTTLEVAGIVPLRVFAIVCLVAMIIADVAFYRWHVLSAGFLRVKILRMAVLVPLCGLASCQSEPLDYYFRELRFDAEGHFIRLQRLPAKPATGPYYLFSSGVYIDIVMHFANVADQPSRLVLHLSTDQDRKLFETTRFEPIASGPFGRIFLTKKCFYKRPPSGYLNALGVDNNLDRSNDYSSPVLLPALPAGHPRITEVTLIRIYQLSPGYLMAAATYEATGELGSVSKSRVKPGGGYISGETDNSGLPGMQVALHLQQQAGALGLPQELAAADYLKLHRVTLSAAANPEVQSMVVLRYGFDDLLQVDTLRDNKPISSSYLMPQITPEDLSLNQRCNSALEHQLASGQRTTW